MLNNDSQLSDYTISTIKKVRQAGHTVLIATGRPYRMAEKFYQQLELDTPMINFNGSLVHIPGKKWQWEQNILIDKNTYSISKRRRNIRGRFYCW